MKDYVSLHNHSQWSLMHSLINPQALFERAKELGQSAIAITDSGTLAAAWDAYQASKKTGVKLIMGCEFFFVDDLSDDAAKITHVNLLAKNHVGYKNLLMLNKMAYDNNSIIYGKVIPRIDWSLLEKYSNGLICTTSCGAGILAYYINTRNTDEALTRAKRLQKIFGDDLAFEIQPHTMVRNASPYNDYEDQTLVNRRLIQFGDELGVKVIAATDAHYLKKEQWMAHDTILSIDSAVPVRAQARLKYTVPEFYVKSREEVEEFFRRHYGERAAEFCDNTIYFSNKCEDPKWIDPKFSNPSGKELPQFPVENQDDYLEFKSWLSNKSKEFRALSEDISYLRYLCSIGARKLVPQDKADVYRDRVIKELDVIESLGFSSYMLIVADIIHFCKKNNYPYGLGRGSVGGCLVAYLLGIHKADPIKYGLIFERFLNKEKKSYPDIDCDFASHVKKMVQEYIIDKYGADYVAHVSNINTITPKVYARDIARAHQFGGDRKSAVEIGTLIADSIPDGIKSVSTALEEAPLFGEFANKYSELKTFANDIGGLPRAWSTHAGGLIIGKRPLHEIVPLRRDKDGNVAIEYEKERAEANGLVKMDILGLSSLDVIANTLMIIKASGKPMPAGLWDFDSNDPKTYELISNGDTLCVFQLGTSSGTIDLCRKVRPKCIEDVAIINSLARPSARDIREDFIKTKNGDKEVDIMHESLQRAFGDTYGFGLYEECLMYLAQDVAGWDLNRADRLRKLTKDKGKNPKKAKQWRSEFIDDSINVGIDKEVAESIWDQVVDKFQGYGFNKSHAIFYSMLGYQTAYLKAHYPVEFLTANLILEDDSNAKISEKNIFRIKREMRKNGIRILPPDINKSETAYKILDDKTLLTGFSSLKFMGKDAIPDILAKRPFKSFEDFMLRIDGRKTRMTAVQALIGAGCFDLFGMTRKQMYLYAKDYRDKLKSFKKRNPDKDFNYPFPDDIGEWSTSEKYAMEVKYLGEAFCCDTKDAYPGFFDNWAIDFSTLPEIFPDPGHNESIFLSSDQGVVEGIVVDVFEFKVKNENSKIFGETMAKVDIEDKCGNIASMAIFPSGLENFHKRLRLLTGGKAKLEAGIGIHCNVKLNWYEGEISMIFQDLTRATPIPPLPTDREHKKVSMKEAAKKTFIKNDWYKNGKPNPESLLDLVEHELVMLGHSTDDHNDPNGD